MGKKLCNKKSIKIAKTTKLTVENKIMTKGTKMAETTTQDRQKTKGKEHWRKKATCMIRLVMCRRSVAPAGLAQGRLLERSAVMMPRDHQKVHHIIKRDTLAALTGPLSKWASANFGRLMCGESPELSLT